MRNNQPDETVLLKLKLEIKNSNCMMMYMVWSLIKTLICDDFDLENQKQRG
jgi:hypothetical protein